MSVSVVELVRRLYLDVLRVDSPGRRLGGRPGSDGRGRLYWHSWDGSSSCAVLPDRGSQRSRGSMSSREWLACLSIRRRGLAASPQCRCHRTCTATSSTCCAHAWWTSCVPDPTWSSTSRSGPVACGTSTG